MRALRALGALLLLGVLLLGVPWFLARFTEPGYLLEADWRTALTVALESRLLLALLGAVAWLAWGWLALTVIAEAISLASRARIRIRVPGTAWARPAVAALILAAVAAPQATVAVADPVDIAAPPPAGVSSAVVTATPVQASADGARRYVVQPGDELWSVAEAELGAGERWRVIADLNPGLDVNARLEPGSTLRLPEAAPAPAPTDQVVVVQRGDTLWDLADSELGDPTRWPEIFELNRDQIADPDEIDAGWVLALPADAATPAGPVPAAAPEPPPAPVAAPPGLPTSPTDLHPGTPPIAPAPPTTPAPPIATPAVATARPDSDGQVSQPDVQTGSADLAPVGAAAAVGSLLAGGVIGVVATRRRAQLLARAIGRRLIPASPRTAAFWTALARRAEDDDQQVPEDATPTTVVVGWEGETPVTVDLEARRLTLATGPRAAELLGATITTLACAPWADTVELVVVGDPAWANALDDPRVSSLPDADAGLRHLLRTCSERRLALGADTLASRRRGPEGDAWHGVVYVFASLTAAELDGVGDALALGEVGVAVLGRTAAPPHLPAAVIRVDDDTATLDGRTFAPQLLPDPARHALLDLFAVTGSLDTEAAPWWHRPAMPPNVLPLTRSVPSEERPMPPPNAVPVHPTLLLLGEVELLATAGDEPNRATGQCMEYCAWLLANPGATAATMTDDLLVAETTRRSNMSRLRTWLGTADDGVAYLPDAYSGRIRLDPRVSSDWEQFQALLAGGVNVATGASLREALRLVRGEPFGSRAFQWHWAHQLQADIVSTVVDAACVLADRALEHDDQEMALWAVGRARLASPESDLLAVREIDALAAAGRHDELQRAIVALNRSTRSTGRDLPVELARRVQRAIHLGVTRATAGP